MHISVPVAIWKRFRVSTCGTVMRSPLKVGRSQNVAATLPSQQTGTCPRSPLRLLRAPLRTRFLVPLLVLSIAVVPIGMHPVVPGFYGTVDGRRRLPRYMCATAAVVALGCGRCGVDVPRCPGALWSRCFVTGMKTAVGGSLLLLFGALEMKDEI